VLHVACREISAPGSDNASDERVANLGWAPGLLADSGDQTSRRCGILVKSQDSILNIGVNDSRKLMLKVGAAAAGRE